MIKNKDGRRIEGDDQCPGNQTDGINQVHHLPSHEACSPRKEKNPVTESPEPLIVKSFRPFFFTEENFLEKINGGAHRAEPSAEEIPKDNNEEKHPKCRKHPKNDSLLREDGDDTDEGIESKVEINRDLQFKGKSGFEDQIEKEEKGEGLNCSPHNMNCFCHVALTLFTLIFERSI
jgi:hypothetical protein